MVIILCAFALKRTKAKGFKSYGHQNIGSDGSVLFQPTQYTLKTVSETEENPRFFKMMRLSKTEVNDNIYKNLDTR